MSVLVTQGHEKGIGLEVLFKAFLTLPKKFCPSIHLIAFKDSVTTTLNSLKIPYELNSNHILLSETKLAVTWQNESTRTQTHECLLTAFNILSQSRGVLFTLPSSKDQFPNGLNGHTEFFRSHFNNSNLGMFFSSPTKKILLISDHIAIKNLPSYIKSKLIFDKVSLALDTFKSWHILFDHIYFSGFNPHCGEGGLMGNEDDEISKAILKLSHKFPATFQGPFSGDTLFNLSHSSNDLLVYMFHDQGLAPFKATQGYIGSNITLGLPFPRLSPDHGTSFSLYGKNVADYRGCSYSLREAILLKENINHGKNRDYKGKGP